MYDVAPVTTRGSDETRTEENRLDSFAKWAKMWRSLILSSLERTAYPYCRYVRALDLRDLQELLEESKGRQTRSFFLGELSEFYESALAGPSRRAAAAKIVNRIGDVITRNTPMLEELTGTITSEYLAQWVPRLPNLQQLWLWDGSALRGTGSFIARHCPRFRSIKFYLWLAETTDQDFADFLEGLEVGSLQFIEIFSQSLIGAKVVESLARHKRSLVELKLGGVGKEVLVSLPSLGPCPLLTTLQLKSVSGEDSSIVEGDLITISGWLSECKSLKEISFQGMLSAPRILSRVLLDPGIQLRELEVSNYPANGDTTRSFHRALGSQAESLRSLTLHTNSEVYDNEVLVCALCKLTALTELRLQMVSDSFKNEDIASLARSLSELEDLWTGGWNITDEIWEPLSRLRKLKRLEIAAFTTFTLDGILNYIESLGPGNAGLALNISMADPRLALSDDEQLFAHSQLAESVGGRFEYTLGRGSAAPVLHAVNGPDLFPAYEDRPRPPFFRVPFEKLLD